MDLREGRRRAVRMEAEVQTLAGDSECRASGRVRDVSLSGLYLELTDSVVSKNTRLRLTVSPEESGDDRAHVWHCIVMRLDEHGVGAMFEPEDPFAVDGLLDLMRESIGVRLVQDGQRHDSLCTP